MSNITHNNQTLLITRHDEVTHEYEPTTKQQVLNALEQALRSAGEAIKVEVIAQVYDIVHRTKFNKRRHQLLREARNERHIARIGLVRTSS